MLFTHRKIAGFAAAVALMAAAGFAAPASAQESPLSLEARTGATLAFGDLSDDGVESGLIGGVDAFYAVGPALSVYGGWGYHGFSDGWSASGPRVGVKALFPQPGGSTPWIRGGVTFNQSQNDVGVSSDRAIGFEAGGGFDFAVTERLSLTPGLRYHNFTAEFGPADVSHTYFTIDLGLHLHF